jgi:hypothetical protein
MSRSRRDSAQINQFEHDEIVNAKRVTITDTELSIELSADDGDSVQVQGRILTSSPIDDTAIDVSAYKEIRVYTKTANAGPKTPLSIKVSPVASGDVWIEIATVAPSETLDAVVASNILPILARRVRIDGIDIAEATVNVVLRG